VSQVVTWFSNLKGGYPFADGAAFRLLANRQPIIYADSGGPPIALHTFFPARNFIDGRRLNADSLCPSVGDGAASSPRKSTLLPRFIARARHTAHTPRPDAPRDKAWRVPVSLIITALGLGSANFFDASLIIMYGEQ
jgi:hypothetical protein